MTSSTTSPPAGGTDLRVVRPLTAAPRLGDRPFKVANALPGHPLFTRDRIRKLLRTVPRARIEVREVPVSEVPGEGYRRGARLDLDPVEALDRLERQPLWMLVHDMWKHDADYGDLLGQYLDDLAASFDELRRPVSDVGCWLFCSSGNSVVHFHADPDQSFLNQIEGSKTVYVYPATLLPEPTIECLAYYEDQGCVGYDAAYEPRMFEPAHIAPGESVFLPLYAPHRVTNDDGVCISWNVGFHTGVSRRRRAVHRVNHELRHLGKTPAPFGAHPMRDTMKRRTRFFFSLKNRLFPAGKPRISADPSPARTTHA